MKPNHNQQLAIDANEQKLLIVASAGSGKTTVLVEKASSIITEQKNDPKSVLMLTFSNKAAKQMKERLLDNIGPAARHVTISTFHAFALKLLKQFPEYSELGKFFKVIDEDERNRFLYTLVNKLNISKASAREYKEKLNKFNEGFSSIPDEFQNLHAELKDKLLELHMVEVSDLIPHAARMLNENVEVISFVKDYYRYILIDEYQDINLQQYDFIRPLIESAVQFIAVGDDDQCIYEWRGSKPEIMRELASQQDVRKISLTHNYRSQRNVIELSNRIISINKNRIEKKMSSDIPPSSIPSFNLYSNRNEEAKSIAKKILNILNTTPTPHQEIAVLLRNGDQSPTIIVELVQLKIPFVNHNSSLKKSQWILSYIREISLEEIDWVKLINYPKPLDKFAIEDVIQNTQLSLLNAVNLIHELYKLEIDFKDSDLFRSRYETIISLLTLKEEVEKNKRPITYLINFLFNRFSDSGDYLSEADVELFSIAMSIARDYSNLNDDQSLLEFTDHFELIMEEITNSSETGVQIMTLHKAKGLEFDTVFIPGLDVENFPNSYHIRSNDDLEAERRLLYVGITRSKNNLFLSSGKAGAIDGFIKDGFVSEIRSAIKELESVDSSVIVENKIKPTDYEEKIEAKIFTNESKEIILESGFSKTLNSIISKWTIEKFPLISREVKTICDDAESIISDLLRNMEPSRVKLLTNRGFIYGPLKLILDQVLKKETPKVTAYFKSESVYQKFDLIELHQSLINSGLIDKQYTITNLSHLNDYKNFLDSLHHQFESTKRKSTQITIESFNQFEDYLKISIVMSPFVFLNSLELNYQSLELIELALKL